MTPEAFWHTGGYRGLVSRSTYFFSKAPHSLSLSMTHGHIVNSAKPLDIMAAAFKQEVCSKRVEFHPLVNFSYIPHKEFYTPRQKRLLWYGSSSILDIAARNAETLVLITSGKLFPDDDGGDGDGDGDGNDDGEYCRRGLFTRRESRLRLGTAQASREAVFRAQEAQFNEGYVDEQEIALKYSKAAYASRLEARNQGARDESDSPNKPMFRQQASSTTTGAGRGVVKQKGASSSRRRHSLVGDCGPSSASPARYQPRRRISALGHL